MTRPIIYFEQVLSTGDYEAYSPNSVEGAFSEIQAVGSTHPPCDSQSYDGLEIRFSTTLGEEPVVEVGLRRVRKPIGWVKTALSGFPDGRLSVRC